MRNFVKNAGMFSWRRLLYVQILVALSPITAKPCQCIEYGTPACAQYWRARAVFIALVIEIDQPRNKYDAYPEGTKVQLLVEEVLSGKVDKEVFDTQGNGADCKLIYEKGERYLIYDSGYDPKTKMIATSVCQGSTELGSAQGELEYIRDLATKPPAPSVMGRVVIERYDPAAGVEIRIEGMRKKFRARTDEHGDFEVQVSKPGKYTIKALVPFAAAAFDYAGAEPPVMANEPTEKMTLMHYEAELKKGQCHYRQINIFKVDLKATASLTGKIIDSTGQPVPRLTVYLYPVSEIHNQSADYEFAITDAEGVYKMEGLRAGSFYLGVNVRQVPDVSAPYPETFYPGVSSLDQARIVHLEQEQFLRSINLRLPPRLIEREITGRIVWPDGTPVLKLDYDPETLAPPYLSFKDGQTLRHVSQLRGIGNSAQKIDEKGNFSIVGFDGYAYVIHARAFDRNDRPMRSRYMRVMATEDFKPITLVLSIPDDHSVSDDEIRREIDERP
jgi:protocatechuate 3,4-dioxygenase beta subunit